MLFLFRGLLRFDENNLPVNDIAENVQISDDQLTYTVNIKKMM